MGQLIIFEGLDGSGKGTQTKLTAKRLKEQGRELRQISAVPGIPEGLFSEGKAGDDLGEPDDRESACSCTAVE